MKAKMIDSITKVKAASTTPSQTKAPIVFIPSIEDGYLSWENNGGLDNPEPIKVVGEDGYTPEKGVDYFTEEDKQDIIDAILADFVNVAEVGQ